jgi:hypothetical protein
MRAARSVVWLVVLGCGPAEDDVPDAVVPPVGTPYVPTASPDEGFSPVRLLPDEEGCPGQYAQELLPTFELTIEEEVWQTLQEEWAAGVALQADEVAGDIEDRNPYHPLRTFAYEGVQLHDLSLRLRGNPDFWLSQGKLQLQVSFNEHDPDGRFVGLRKLLFDAAAFNRSFLRDRLALSVMRDLGLPAPCANNARLVINGTYYGLFTSVERIDKEFLSRNFEDDGGDLWRRGAWELRTNEETATRERLDALNAATTIEELEQYLDLEQALTLFAVDAVLPNADGPWAGGLNFYLYDDPARGRFVILPWDLDNGFTRLPAEVDPVTWRKEERFYGRPWFDLLLADPGWAARYREEIGRVLDEGYVVERLQERIERWHEQVADAAIEDPNKPFGNRAFFDDTVDLHLYVQERERFLRGWLGEGGVD